MNPVVKNEVLSTIEVRSERAKLSSIGARATAEREPDWIAALDANNHLIDQDETSINYPNLPQPEA